MIYDLVRQWKQKIYQQQYTCTLRHALICKLDEIESFKGPYTVFGNKGYRLEITTDLKFLDLVQCSGD